MGLNLCGYRQHIFRQQLFLHELLARLHSYNTARGSPVIQPLCSALKIQVVLTFTACKSCKPRPLSHISSSLQAKVLDLRFWIVKSHRYKQTCLTPESGGTARAQASQLSFKTLNITSTTQSITSVIYVNLRQAYKINNPAAKKHQMY